MTSWFEAGHAVCVGQRIDVRFSTSSTSRVTAFLSRAELSGATTTRAWLRSRATAGESPGSAITRRRNQKQRTLNIEHECISPLEDQQRCFPLTPSLSLGEREIVR